MKIDFIKGVYEMETITKATDYSTSSMIQPAFTQISTTQWGKDYIKMREFEEQISFGLWHQEGGWPEDPVMIRWYKTDKGLRHQIFDYEGLERQKAIHPEIFDFLKKDKIQPELLRQKLIEFGYTDVTNQQ